MNNNTATTKRQTNRQRALALAAEHGVEIYFSSGRSRRAVPTWYAEWDVPAPDGMVWYATESHFLTCSWELELGHPDARADRWWKMLADDLAAGLVPCPYRPTCECCD
jgi:hypothetical protein